MSEASWTKFTGEIVGRDYVRREIRKRLQAWPLLKLADNRDEVLEIVCSDAWLAGTNGMVVGGVVATAKLTARDNIKFRKAEEGDA